MESLRWTNEEYLEECPKITLAELEAFVPTLFSKMHVVSFACGNISKKESVDAVSKLIEIIGSQSVALSEFQLRKFAKLQDGKKYLRRIKGFNPDDLNSAIELSFQVGPEEVRLRTLLALFVQCVQNHCFNTLRTEQQLGYLVWSGTRFDFGVCAFRVIVQSQGHDPEDVQERIEKWLASMEKVVEDMSQEEFESYRGALIGIRLEKDKSLREKDGRWRTEVLFPRSHLFRRDEDEAEELNKITKADLLGFYRTYLGPNAEKRRRFASQIYADKHPMPSSTSSDLIAVDDCRSFVGKAEFHSPIFSFAEDLQRK
jgi:secreted Zn-dependent insulinase-like peptidase